MSTSQVARTPRRWPLQTFVGNAIVAVVLDMLMFVIAHDGSKIPGAGLLHGLCFVAIWYCGMNAGIILYVRNKRPS